MQKANLNTLAASAQSQRCKVLTRQHSKPVRSAGRASGELSLLPSTHQLTASGALRPMGDDAAYG